MKDIYDFLRTFDMHTIIVVGIAFWWINGTIKELDNRVSSRIENLSEKVARIEGILSCKEFCATSEQIKEK